MLSEEEESSASKEADESDEDSNSGMTGIACASFPAKIFFRNVSSDDETPAYYFMAKASKEKDYVSGYTEWIMDSGCTSHMTGDKSLFVDPNLTSSPLKYITFGDNNKGKVIGLGKIAISFSRIQSYVSWQAM